MAKGVLTKQLGPWKRPVAYFSKKLDNVAMGWPPCREVIMFRSEYHTDIGQH
ncbi:Pol polyprotein [Cricetulus griseus]|uniref:Pol polyprotein n=1 Tax=Cricetulus griseus TaxID=10029 RepID=G3HGI6_CRIGR|nr:Pol polyprotein [Cricetulus griseus]